MLTASYMAGPTAPRSSHMEGIPWLARVDRILEGVAILIIHVLLLGF